jgi:hypothetical protein
MRFPAAVAAAFVLAALPAPAQAAGCVWTAAGLPSHPNVEHERVTGMSPDGTITVGDATNIDYGVLNGVLWFGTTPVGMADPNRGPGVDNSPWGVNNAGVVVGYTYDNNTGVTSSYRYHSQDGTYEWLQVPSGNGAAGFVNERGDVAGWIDDGGESRTVVWRAGSVQPVVIGRGRPAGLDEEGRVVTTEGEIWSPDAKTVRIRDRRGAHPQHYAHGHAVGVNSNGEIVEWGLRGNITRVIPGAAAVEAVNARGVIAGLHVDGARRSWAIWTGGEPQDVDGYVVGITDSGVAYGQRGWDAVVYRCS